jgi:hypothetical protein
MSWSYRVVKYVTKIPLGDTDISYGVHSVYTDYNGDIVNISENPTYPISDALEGLKNVLSKMMESCNKPVIDYHTGEEIEENKCSS